MSLKRGVGSDYLQGHLASLCLVSTLWNWQRGCSGAAGSRMVPLLRLEAEGCQLCHCTVLQDCLPHLNISLVYPFYNPNPLRVIQCWENLGHLLMCPPTLTSVISLLCQCAAAG